MRMRMSVKVEAAKKNCESIHSGQFMVSHFEQEEEPDNEDYQDPDDVVDDDEDCEEIIDTTVKLIPGPSTSVAGISTQLERYKPPLIATSRHHEIDSDLSQVFNTLNVTYKQKLTSPRWNPFKGIKLRWKEKIRLNNVIWRCWHMQFILKKRPLVCQFASPLDVDIHNTPQAIILEGKYWKRKWKVITAEYKKWRRYNVKALGTCNILDTRSELDTLEWATNENLLLLQDNMSSDTLFSTISQIPFPDSREIARAGRADFIQPSLGPLQPNFEDFMDFDLGLDILNNLANNRLAPVPEEQTEDLFRAIEFPMISSIDSSTMQDMMSPAQQGVIHNNRNAMNQPQNATNANSLLFTATIFTQDLSQNANNQQGMSMQNRQSSTTADTASQQAMMNDLNPFLSGGIEIAQPSSNQERMMPSPTELDEKDLYKGKFSRISQFKAQLPKREPHNYDKCQPTAHQTTIYNQMLAQQQETPPIPAQMYNANPHYGNMTDVNTNINHMSPIQTTTNNYASASATAASAGNNVNSSSNSSVLNLSNNLIYANKMLTNLQQQGNLQTQQQAMSQLAMDQQQQQQALEVSYKSPQSPSYRSYHHSNQQPYKIPSQSVVYGTNRLMMRQPSPPHSSGGNPGKSMSFQQHQQTSKESYRSNSLPINANMQLPKDLLTSSGVDFAVPKYPNTSSSAIVNSAASKGRDSRARSNSINLHGQLMTVTPLQSATSEPTLNANASSALAQLLTNSSVASLLSQKAHSVSSSAMSYPSVALQQKQHQQPQRASSFTSTSSVQNSISMAVSAINSNQQSKPSTSTNTSGLYQTPTLSPESAFHDSSHHEMSSSMSPERCLSLSKFHPRENQRRAGHIHAEQKRRYNIKNGFDMLHQLIPQLQQNPNAKLSKAAMLCKGADYIKQLRMERGGISEQMESLKAEIDSLTNSLNHLQNALPANGAPINRQRTGRVRQMYQDYVMHKTLTNWKFWIFGLIFEPMLNSFNGTVSTVSMDELYRTTMLWVDNSCTLMEIRPAVSNKLRELSTTTDILSENPTSLQDEVMRAVANLRTRSHESPR